MKKIIPLFLLVALFCYQPFHEKFFPPVARETQSVDDIEMPESLAVAMDSVTGFSISSLWKDEQDVLLENLCALNEAERKTYHVRIGYEEILEEIKYFVKVQEKYIKTELGEQAASYGDVCRDKCHEAKARQACIYAMAVRRKDKLGSSGSGFTCFEKYESGYTYLNTGILTSGLVDRSESFESKIDNEKHEMSLCRYKIHEQEKAACIKKREKNIQKLLNECPIDLVTSNEIKRLSGVDDNALTAN